MQEILKGLSQKKGENKESEQTMDLENQKLSVLIDELRHLLADREAKVKTLEEEIGQLTHQVSKLIRGAHMVITSDLLFHFLVPCYLRWLLPPDSDSCPP